MSKLTEIILRAGILPPSTLVEMQRWGLPVGDPKKAEYSAEMTADALSRSIAQAIEGEGYVLTRETDLGAITQYLQTMRDGVLHVVIEDGSSSNMEVPVGRTPTGEWILPWREDDITDILTNGETYLKIDKKKIFFNQARELFYGQHKAFIVCTPSTVESQDGDAG